MSSVSALLHGNCLTLTDLGRAMPSEAYTKHSIKRVDRLLGNAHLQHERPLFYWKMFTALIGSLPSWWIARQSMPRLTFTCCERQSRWPVERFLCTRACMIVKAALSVRGNCLMHLNSYCPRTAYRSW